MKRNWKVTAGILTIVFCMLLGCEKKEMQGESLLLVPVEEKVQENSDNEAEEETQPEEPRELVVHICGAVKNPGVYVLQDSSRIYQAVEAAGGFLENAEENYLNQADLLIDGMKIYVPTVEEIEEQELSEGFLESSAGSLIEKSAGNAGSGLTGEVNNGLVNINTASAELLCTLPGVGDSKAESIIAYREEIGSFQKIEDIMKVQGIKDGLFQKIKDKITV